MSTRSRSVSAVVSLVVVAGLLLVYGCLRGGTRPGPIRPIALTGGGVHGTVYVPMPVKDDAGGQPGMIVLPDIKVYLHNVGTGENSDAQTTDLFGRYMFPPQKRGTYELRWDAQSGWAAGAHPEKVVVTANTQYPTPARIAPDKRTGMIYGRVTFADNSGPWFYDELFATRKTATVTVLNSARTATLAGPVQANVHGYYAVAGLARGTDVSVRATLEAANVTRVAAAAAISFGQPVAAQDIELPNHRPEIVAVVPELAGNPVETAAAGETITLNALTRDSENDALQFEWKLLDGMGTIAPSGSTAQWKLPSSAGLYTAYLLVKDGRGGYARQSVDFQVAKTHATFSGRAVDETGAVVSGATVSVNGITGTTDTNGFFRLQSPLVSRYVLNIYKTGYALFSRVVDSEATGQTWVLAKTLTQVVDPTKPIDLVDRRPQLDQRKLRGARISVPANALVDAAGNKPTGNLTAYYLTLDIGRGQGPGDWGTMTAGGKETNLLSYGAAFVEFLDSAGRKYNLAAGQSAGTEMFPPSTMLATAPPGALMWSYDETDGYWKETGTATLNPATGSYVGKVTHFSTINTDIEKDNAACLRVLLYPPIPTGVTLRVSDAPGGAGADFAQAYSFVLDSALNAVYRLPADTDVQLELFDTDGVTEFEGLVLEDPAGTALSGNVVNTGPASTPLWPDEPYENCKLVILRLDVEAAPSVFLTFKDEGTAAQAEAYYNAIDPDGLRTTLGEWWEVNGFDFGSDGFTPGEVPANSIRTSYLNNNDLGSGRDMHFLQRSDGTVAAYVTNYGDFDQDHGDADLAATRDTPGATVCMEYSPVEGQGATRIVKFFVYAGGGDNEDLSVRQPGAELDGLGVKFVPNLCLNCHGGSYYPADPANPSFADVNMLASFCELDVATYKFPEGRDTPNSTELAAFRQQNEIVAGASPGDTITRDAIKELIAGWYPSAADDQDNTWTPSGWVGAPQEDLYHTMIKTSCRTCHVAFVSDDGPGGNNWVSYEQLQGRNSFLDSFVLCEDRYMPHAVVTYRNFWLSADPHQPGFLRDFDDGSDWSTIGPCVVGP